MLIVRKNRKEKESSYTAGEIWYSSILDDYKM